MTRTMHLPPSYVGDALEDGNPLASRPGLRSIVVREVDERGRVTLREIIRWDAEATCEPS